MKHILSVCLSLALVFALCACGTEGGIAASESGKRKTSKVDTLDAILADIETDYGATIQKLSDELTKINTKINGDYKAYVKNRGMIDDWYALVREESAALFERTEENCRRYILLMPEQVEHTYSDMQDAAEKIFDTVYDDAQDEFYDEVCDRMMDDLFDDYYDGVIDDAYNLVPYKEYSDQISYFYEAWSDAWSDIYDLWSDNGKTVYEMWSDVTSAIYRENYDFQSVLVVHESMEADGQGDKTTENDSLGMLPDDNSFLTESSVRPEFKSLMDSYENFFEEYVSYARLLAENPDDLTLLSEYADFVDRYTEAVNALDNIDENELTAGEIEYYIDTMSRIQQMLLTITG